MKKWRRFFQQLFISHIAAFEEQVNNCGPYKPAAHATVIRSSIKRYFKSAGPHSVYILAYDTLYEAAIMELKEEGWMIRLEVDGRGELYYLIRAGSPTECATLRF